MVGSSASLLQSLATRDEVGEATPLDGVGALLEQALKDAQDRPELAVVDPNDDRAAGMIAPGLGPAPHDLGEVLDVEGDQDALFIARQGQERLIGPTVELTLLIGGENVVAATAQGLGDPGPREMSVKQKAQCALLLGGRIYLDEGVFGSQLSKRAVLESDRLVDLLGKALVVSQGEPNLPLVQAA